jgi:MscS family membrane protein
MLIIAWIWAFWAAAAVSTNSPPPSTNEPPTLLREFQHLDAHSLTFGLDEFAPLHDHSFLGEPLWKYLASLLYILMAILAAKLIDLIGGVWLKRLAMRTESKLDDLVLELLRGPIKVVVFALLINVGLNFFDWSPKVKSYFFKSLILVVAAALTYLALRVIDILLTAWRRRHEQEGDRRFNDQLFSVIRISLTTFIIVVAILVTAQNMDINITAAIASLSIGGLAVGLAAQDTLANLFGALAMFVDKPFRVGDHIKLDGAEGSVEIVGLRSTRVRSPDGNLIAVPNKTMGNATITNLSQRPFIKTVFNLVLPRDLSPDRIKQVVTVLEGIYRAHPMTQQAWVSFNQFAGANINIRIEHWWRGIDQQQYLTGIQELNLAVKARLAAEGVNLV